MTTEHSEALVAVVKTAPPVVVTSGSILGVPLPDILLWATLVYTVLQLVLLAPRVVEAVAKVRQWLVDKLP